MFAGRDTERKVPGPIERSRLVRRCADASVVVLEAPGGFGKSTLAEQLTVEARTTARVFLTTGDASGARLVARLRDACSAAGLSAAAR